MGRYSKKKFNVRTAGNDKPSGSIPVEPPDTPDEEPVVAPDDNDKPSPGAPPDTGDLVPGVLYLRERDGKVEIHRTLLMRLMDLSIDKWKQLIANAGIVRSRRTDGYYPLHELQAIIKSAASPTTNARDLKREKEIALLDRDIQLKDIRIAKEKGVLIEREEASKCFLDTLQETVAWMQLFPYTICSEVNPDAPLHAQTVMAKEAARHMELVAKGELQVCDKIVDILESKHSDSEKVTQLKRYFNGK